MWRPCTTCSWRFGAILVTRQTYAYSRQNFGGVGCNYKFNNLFFDVWHVIEYGHHSTHQDLNYSPYDYWVGLLDGAWIFPAHWVWHFDITTMFWLWSSISLSGWSWCPCYIEAMNELPMHFRTMCPISLDLQPRYGISKGSLGCVRRHW
jgi:hypothetical protein